jgi:hypothetical protein
MTTTNLGVLSDRLTLGGHVDNDNPVDLVNFSVAPGSSLNAGLVGLGADANLRLFRAGNATPIAESLNTGTTNEAINLSNLTTGDYSLQINHVGAANTDYTVNLTTARFNDVITGGQNIGTITLAGTLGFTGFINNNNTADQFRFHLDTTSTLNATVTGLSANLDLEIFSDSNGSGFVDSGDFTLFSTAGGSSSESRSVRFVPAGDYIAQVHQGSPTASSSYTLHLSTSDLDNLFGEEENLGTLTNTPITRNGFGAIGDSETSRMYRFDVTDDTSGLNIALTGLTQDLDVRLLHDVSGDGIVGTEDEMVRSIFGSTTPDSINLVSLAKGTYYVQIYQIGHNTSNYTLQLSTGVPSTLIAPEENLGTLTPTPITRHGALSRNDMSDFYQFNLTGNSDVNLALFTEAFGANFDVRLIQDIDGNGIAGDGDIIVSSTNAGNTADAINVRSLLAGNYFVQVFAKQVGSSSSYTLNLSSSTPNNLIAAEENFGPLGNTVITRTGTINDQDTDDMYRFTTDGNNPINIALTQFTGDLDLFLIQDVNNNGIRDEEDTVASSKRLSNTPESINLRGLPAGAYFIEVRQFSSSSTSYTLHLSNTFPSNLIAEEENLGTLATPTSQGTAASFQRTGKIDDKDTSDMYRFNIGGAKSVHFLLDGLSQDLDLRIIRDVDGDGIADPEDTVRESRHSSTTPEDFIQQLDAGSYIVQVEQFAHNASNYTLTIS